MSRPSPQADGAYRRHCLRGALMNVAVAGAWLWVGIRYSQFVWQAGVVVGCCVTLTTLWVLRGWSR